MNYIHSHGALFYIVHIVNFAKKQRKGKKQSMSQTKYYTKHELEVAKLNGIKSCRSYLNLIHFYFIGHLVTESGSLGQQT